MYAPYVKIYREGDFRYDIIEKGEKSQIKNTKISLRESSKDQNQGKLSKKSGKK